VKNHFNISKKKWESKGAFEKNAMEKITLFTSPPPKKEDYYTLSPWGEFNPQK